MKRTKPIIVQVYCRLEVKVTDPDAVINRAAQELREADIDWAEEGDDVDSAVAALRASLPNSLVAILDEAQIFEGVPGVVFRGGHTWAEIGTPRESFLRTMP
jgi:hypothetical protein